MALSNKKTLPFKDKSEYKKGSGVMCSALIIAAPLTACKVTL